jgi:hypothetical protein
MAEPAEAVDLGGALVVHRHTEIGEGEHVLLQAVAPVMIGLLHRVPLLDHLPRLGVDRVGHARAGVLGGVRPGPVGRPPVAELAEDAQRTAADADAPAAVHVHGGAVVGIVVGDVPAGVAVNEGGEGAVLEHQVHHPGDGVGAVLGGGAVAEHLDPVQGAGGHGVEVDAARPGAPAVHQHQGVVGAQAPEGEGPDDVAGVGDALARKVHRG